MANCADRHAQVVVSHPCLYDSEARLYVDVNGVWRQIIVPISISKEGNKSLENGRSSFKNID